MPRESSSGPSVCRSSSGCIWMRWARCVCGSTPPGTTTFPAASITRVASRNVPGAATAAILPSCTAISHAPAPCGVTTWPFLISRSSIACLLEARGGLTAPAYPRLERREPTPRLCEAARVSGRQQSFEPLRERGAGALLLVLEEHERVAPAGAHRADRLDPCRQPCVRVIDRAQPEVAPVGGRQRRRRRLLVLDDGQRGVARPQPLVHVVGEPGRVPELPGHPEIRRHHIKDVGQAADILLEVGRQLEEQGAQPRAETARDVAEDAHGLVDVAQPREVVMRCGALSTNVKSA